MKIWFPAVRTGSGSDVFVNRLLQGLSEEGHKVCVSWFNHWNEIFPLFMSVGGKPRGVDVIHVNSWHGFPFSKHRLPMLATVHHCVHDPVFSKFQSVSQNIYHRTLIKTYEHLGFEHADKVSAVSQYTADITAACFPGVKPGVVANGIESDVFVPSAVVHSSKKFKLLYVGNTSTRKGFDLLPKILARLDDSFELQYSTGLRGGVKLNDPKARYLELPTQADLVAAFQQCDAVLYPTRYEGFGYVACEAMACSKPVIASVTTSLPEVVKHNETGLLCSVDEVGEFVDAIKLLADDRQLRQELGCRGRALVEENFSLGTMVKGYVDLYKSIC